MKLRIHLNRMFHCVTHVSFLAQRRRHSILSILAREVQIISSKFRCNYTQFQSAIFIYFRLYLLSVVIDSEQSKYGQYRYSDNHDDDYYVVIETKI